jgi:hypothetical protein
MTAISEEWEVYIRWRTGREQTYRYVARRAAETALEKLQRDYAKVNSIECFALRGYRIERTLTQEMLTYPGEK